MAIDAEFSMNNDGEDLIKTERLKLMYNAIAQLTDVEKVLVMLYIEDKTYEEMEDILGMTGSLRAKMNCIKEKLRNRFRRMYKKARWN